MTDQDYNCLRKNDKLKYEEINVCQECYVFLVKTQ